MKANEITIEKDNFRFTTDCVAPGKHYKFAMIRGRRMPNSAAQAKFFVDRRITLDVLNMDDVEYLEQLLNKHGYAGEYRYTKSKRWVRLTNIDDLYSAVKKEFNV